MANYNNPNIGTLQQPNLIGQQPQMPRDMMRDPR